MTQDEALHEVEDFHKERIEKILWGEPFPSVNLAEGPRVVLHLIPQNAFYRETYHDLSKITNDQLKPLAAGGSERKFTFDGLITFSLRHDDKWSRYAALFGNGIIERMNGLLGRTDSWRNGLFDALRLEDSMVEQTREYVELLRSIGVVLPICLYLSILGVKECIIKPPPELLNRPEFHPIDRDKLNFQRLRIKRYDTALEKLMKTWFDRLWNACGFESSPHYDQGGNWRATDTSKK